MKRALLFICLSYRMLTLSQTPGIEWTKLYGDPSFIDETRDVDKDAEGNVYMGGTLKLNELDARIRLVKYNSAGTQIWSAIFTPAAKYIQPRLKAMNVDNAGNTCLLIEVAYTGNFYATIIVKYNNLGTKLWTVTEEITDTKLLAGDIHVDNSGYIYVGANLVYSSPASDILVFKYNNSGSKLWGAFYNGSGNGRDLVLDITADNAGNCYVVGITEEKDARTQIVSKKEILIKYSGVGFFQWKKTHWHTGASTSESRVSLDGSGNIYQYTQYAPPIFSDPHVFYLFKYNASGSLLWTQTKSGLLHSSLPMTVDASGNTYLAAIVPGPGLSKEDISIFKYNSSGSLLWNKQYNGGDSTYDEPHKITLDQSGNVYVAGTISKQRTIEGILQLAPNVLTLKYNSAGTLQWAANYKATKSNPYSYGKSLVTFGNGATPVVYAAGITKTIVGPDGTLFQDMLLIKYNPAVLNKSSSILEPLAVVERPVKFGLNASPNPFRGRTVIRFDLPVNAKVSLKVYDVLGREVSTLVNGNRAAGQYSVNFDAGTRLSKQYFYTLTTSSSRGEFRETRALLTAE